MAEPNRQAELIAWLQSQGYFQHEIDKILQKVAEYDEQTVHESVFDSIDSGALDLAAIVKEALEQEETDEG